MFSNFHNIYIQRIFKTIPGPYWGLFSIVVGLLGDFLAFMVYPDYNLNLMVSDLGTGPGALYFNLGTILSGLFALLFYLYIGPHLKVKDINNKAHNAAMILAVLSCIFFIFIGIFPSLRSNVVLFVLHGGTAMLSWICGIGYKSLFSYFILKNDKFYKVQGYSGLAVVLIEIIFLFTWIPVIEWIMVFAITFWISLLTIHSFRYLESNNSTQAYQ